MDGSDGAGPRADNQRFGFQRVAAPAGLSALRDLGSPGYDSLLTEIRAARAASRLVPLGTVPRPPAIVTGPFANGLQGGVWCRQPLTAYQTGSGAPDRILNLDSLSRAEGPATRSPLSNVWNRSMSAAFCAFPAMAAGGARRCGSSMPVAGSSCRTKSCWRGAEVPIWQKLCAYINLPFHKRETWQGNQDT